MFRVYVAIALPFICVAYLCYSVIKVKLDNRRKCNEILSEGLDQQ